MLLEKKILGPSTPRSRVPSPRPAPLGFPFLIPVPVVRRRLLLANDVHRALFDSEHEREELSEVDLA